MSKNPVNLAIRFLLELIAIFCFGRWGYSLPGSRGISVLAAIAMVALFALLWGGICCSQRSQPVRENRY